MALSKNLSKRTILQLFDAGMRTSEIASELGVTPATVTYWKRKLGKDIAVRRQDWKSIQEAHNAGATYMDLYEMFGVAKRSLQKAKERGVFIPRLRVRVSEERKRARQRECWVRYMARKKYQTPVDEDLSALQEFYANCPKGYEVDHIIPISKGGKHALSNLQYLTKQENRRKSNKIIEG